MAVRILLRRHRGRLFAQATNDLISTSFPVEMGSSVVEADSAVNLLNICDLRLPMVNHDIAEPSSTRERIPGVLHLSAGASP